MNRRSLTLLSLLALAGACSDDLATPPATGVPGAAGGVAPVPTATSATPAMPGTTSGATTTPGTNTGVSMGPSTGTPTTTPAMNPGTSTTEKPGTTPPATGGPGTTGTDAASCRGFSFENLIYSPGGNVLPNTCKPYDPTTNNPYAVRCVDAWPWYKTTYPGDDFCILPPAPDKGVQYGVHPQGQKWFEQVSKGDLSGYANPTDQWLMKDGEEEQANYQTSAATTAMNNYYRNYARMRPGSHHMIVSVQTAAGTPEAWGPATMTGLTGGVSLPGAQRPDENAPKSLDKPMEDKGLFAKLPANPAIVFNMHHFNASGKTILKEAWTNLWWESDATIETHGILGLDVGQVIGLAVPPGTVQDLHYSWNITQPIRLIDVFGHRHAWTSNFSAWIDEGGKQEIIYQSFKWLDEPTYRYDSMTMNPPPKPEAKTDGASSGLRMLMPGQKLHFNCHIEFTDARAQSEGGPMPAQVGTLRFANEAFTAEMCILFGSTAAVSLGTPAADASALPTFATMSDR
jgi:hypothetical protein